MDGSSSAIPLGREDRAILALESATVAGHTCKVVRLGPGAPSIDALRERIARRIVDAPLLTRRLGGDADAPGWVVEPGFDVARHVEEAALPPGAAASPPLPPTAAVPPPATARPDAAAAPDRARLLATVAALFAQRLPRDRPLWKMDVVPLPDGGALLVWRIHHALADGTATMRYARTLLWDGSPQTARTPAQVVAEHAADEARRRGHLAAYLRREFARSRHRSPFDGAIGTQREIGFGVVGFGALHDAARALDGATVNDALLALVAGALREWLEQHHGAIGELRVRVPVSLHHEGDDAANRDSFFSLALPLGEPDPVARLRAIHAQTRVRKDDRDAERRDQLLQELSAVSPQLRGFATRLERSPRRFALSVSNVVGPRTPVELLSAPVQALHGLAEIGERHALRVAVTSFDDRLCVGLLADPVLVPGVQTIADEIERAAELLVAAASG